MSKIKKIVTDIAKKNIIFRKIVRKLLFIVRRLKYISLSANKVDDKLILFESFMGRSYSDSPKAIYEYLIKSQEYADFKFVWAFKDPDLRKVFFDDERTTLIKYGSKEYYRYYGKAKCWVSNSRIPEQITKKKDQLYIQTWHGTPLKKLGFDIHVEGLNALNTVSEIRYKYEVDAKRYDFLLSSSRYCTEKLSSAFNLKDIGKENTVLELGYPRNDFLFSYGQADMLRVKDQLHIPADKKIILYAPTWRDNQHVAGLGYTYDIGVDFKLLQEKLSDEYVILFRAHYFISNSFDFEEYKDFLFDVSKIDDINELYVISDVLITDYSSVFFDYANLKRPILFYMYDLDEYQNRIRDFYISLDELPGPIAMTSEDLIKEINGLKLYNNKYGEKYHDFNKKYNYLDGSDCSEKVVNKVFAKKLQLIEERE